MATIIFDTLVGGGSLTLTTPTIVYGTDFSDARYNQSSHRTGDGTLVTYNPAGLSVVTGVIIMKGVLLSEGNALKTWLHDKAIFGLNKFTITPPTGVDLGLGVSTNVTLCDFVGTDDSSVFRHKVPSIFLIKFPYTFVRV